YGTEERRGDRGRAEGDIPRVHEGRTADGHGVRRHAAVARGDQREHRIPGIREALTIFALRATAGRPADNIRHQEDYAMRVGLRLTYFAAFVIALPAAASAQWLEYPTPGVPRTADGKPDMSAPTPRTTDGKPDLSGMWGWET